MQTLTLALALAACGEDSGAGPSASPNLDAGSDTGTDAAVAVGSITGSVSSDLATPVEGASVTTAAGDFGETTDASGRFVIAELPPGVYDLTASAEGYAATTSLGVEVLEGETTSVEIVLEPLESFGTTCASCHLRSEMLLASLEADPLPEKGGEGASSGEG